MVWSSGKHFASSLSRMLNSNIGLPPWIIVLLVPFYCTPWWADSCVKQSVFFCGQVWIPLPAQYSPTRVQIVHFLGELLDDRNHLPRVYLYSQTPLFRIRLIRSPHYFEGRLNSLGFTLSLYASPVISKPRYFELFSISLGTSK